MSLPELHFLQVALLFVVALLVRHKWAQRQANPGRLPLPPGPKGLPIIGNLLDVPVELPWIGFNKLSQTYGDIINLSVMGQSIIVLSSVESVSDLLEKRAMLYSDRMQSAFLNMIDADWILSLMEYGEKWRRRRRAFHQYFHICVADSYQEIQTQQSRALLQRLLKTPEDFLGHIRLSFGATVMKIMYGIDVKGYNDQYISIAEEAMQKISIAAQVGSLVRHVPAWVPGAGFKRDAAAWKVMVNKMRNKPFDYAKTSFDHEEMPSPCIVTSMLERERVTGNPGDDEDVARDTAGVVYAGGSDTTLAAANSFILAMVLNPDVQHKAQAELDAVIGPNRLPDFSDRSSLPYIEAIYKESLRWHLSTPLGVPHKATGNGEYKGYFIPKGAVVIANAWAILHDPRHYQDPFVFNPERFIKDGKLNPNILDPATVAFGFGRRMCPGLHFASNSLWSMMVSILYTFNITQAVDETGQPIPVTAKFTSGIISLPVPFQCSFKPRSPAAEALIRDIRHDN